MIRHDVTINGIDVRAEYKEDNVGVKSNPDIMIINDKRKCGGRDYNQQALNLLDILRFDSHFDRQLAEKMIFITII